MTLNPNSTYPYAQTFVLRLHRDAAQDGQIMGLLEHVESGRQFHLSSPEELIAGLTLGSIAASQAGEEV